MIVDSSALMAILNGEPEGDSLLAVIARNERLDELLEALEIRVEPVTVRQGEVARLAYRRFGRGSGSKAALNFGDCFAYALCVTAGEPLLFAGDDFAHTDVAAQPY